MTSELHPIHRTPVMSETEWGDLLDGIERQKCLIVVGPEVYTAEGQPSMEKRLAAFLRNQADQLRIRVYDNGWFHLLPMGNETSPYRQVKEFYNRPAPHADEILRTLARIKFPVFISMTPDHKLRRAFNGHPASLETYARNQPYSEDFEKPTPDQPLVYNLLGDIDNRNSLVLTYDDFYDYLKSAFTSNSMSPILKDAILQAEYFLFLGIPFEQWYVHLFMRILKQNKEKRQTQKVAVPYNPSHADSCTEQYTMRFVDDRVAHFVSELLERCENHPAPEKMLRPLPLIKTQEAPEEEKSEPYFARLVELMENNAFDEIYEMVKKVLMGTGRTGKVLLQNFIQLKSRYSKLKEENLLGILSQENYTIQLNKVRLEYIERIDELKEQWPQLNVQL